MIKAGDWWPPKFPPHTETRRLYECVFVGLELDVLQGADYTLPPALTQTLVYRQLGLGLEICVQRMVFMSEHKQYPIHQDHRDHLRIESLDPRMMQPSWGELNAFPLVATEAQKASCIWTWQIASSGGGAWDLVQRLPFWTHTVGLTNFCSRHWTMCLAVVWNFWAYNTWSRGVSSSPKRCSL